MAVTKIRKVSSYTLLAAMLASIAVFALFFFGGSETDAAGNTVYNFTDLLLYWSYALFGAALVAVVIFAVSSLATDAKSAKGAIVGIVAFVVLLAVCYALGSSEPLTSLNEAAQGFNTPGWLKVTDMWLYSSYALLFLCIAAAGFGAISKSLKK